MPRKAVTSTEIKAEVQRLIDEFNQENFNDDEYRDFGIIGYSARFKGKYLYLDRDDLGGPSPIYRLECKGKKSNSPFKRMCKNVSRQWMCEAEMKM